MAKIVSDFLIKIIEAIDSPLSEHIYPPGSFVSIIDYSGIPYEIKGISPNFIKAHHMTIFQAHKLIYSNM
ncbi:MAG: hypothetical protein RSD40_07085 [Bacilli bacterium]